MKAKRISMLVALCMSALVAPMQGPAAAQVTPPARPITAQFIARVDADVYNLPAPMVHQVWDTPDEFSGYWACGPTSSVMAVAYYQRIPPRSITIQAGGTHTNDYGYYVSTEYSVNGNTFNRERNDSRGRPAKGAYGWIMEPACQGGLCAVAYRIQDYLNKHGIDNEFSDRNRTTIDQDIQFTRDKLQQGYLIIAGGQFNIYAHVVLIRGITDDNKFIINDPFGNTLNPSNYGRARDGESVRVGFGSNLRAINWMVVVKGQRTAGQTTPNPSVEVDNRVLSIDGSISAEISPSNDEDTFWFNGNAGSTVKINMNKTGGSLDTYLYLHTPDGRLLTQNDDSNSTTDSEIRAALPVSGRYKIIGRSYNRSSSGNYTLSLSAVAASAADGDDNRWPVFNVQLPGTISPAVDRDTYYFNGSAGTVINIRMNKIDAGLDSYLELYGPTGAKLTENDDGGGNLNSWIAYRLPASGAYRIVARSYNLSSSGSYNLSVSPNYTNLALTADAESSSEENANANVSLVTDGNHDTYWSSGESPTQTLIVDLGSQRSFDQAILRWTDAFASGYGLFYQNNAGQWVELMATNSGDGDVDVITFPRVSARYLLVQMQTRGTIQSRYGIHEVEVHDTPSTLIPLVPPDDINKAPESGVSPLTPLAPVPDGKEQQPFALGADQESFPLSDAPAGQYQPLYAVADTYSAPTATFTLTENGFNSRILATATNARDLDSNQVGTGIVSYRWSLVDTVEGPSGFFVQPLGDTATLDVNNFAKLSPGAYSLVLEVRDDEGVWSAGYSQMVVIPSKVFVPIVVK